jgi:hypothetical protein
VAFSAAMETVRGFTEPALLPILLDLDTFQRREVRSIYTAAACLRSLLASRGVRCAQPTACLCYLLSCG